VSAKELPLPNHYSIRNAVWSYDAPINTLFGEANAFKKEHNITPVSITDKKAHLLLIDAQKDFCFPEGALYVGGRTGRGAVEDSMRIAEFIYKNLGILTGITATLDTHYPYQIFFPTFWLDANGAHPNAHTTITFEDVISGKYRPNPALVDVLNISEEELKDHAVFYCKELARTGKYTLYLWPFHCLLGSNGHNIAGIIDEAIRFHSFVRSAQPNIVIKGTEPLTENYSVFSPEVKRTPRYSRIFHPNENLIQKLLAEDMLIIAGEAASHCVKSSIDDLLDYINRKDKALAKKVYILIDCMSSVAVPDEKGGFIADFTDVAETALKRYAAAGMNLVKSTDPIESFPNGGAK